MAKSSNGGSVQDYPTLLTHPKMEYKVCCFSLQAGVITFFKQNLPSPNPSLWSSMIRVLFEYGVGTNFVGFYNSMLPNDVAPSKATFSLILRSCAALFATQLGESFHCQIIKFGYEFDLFLHTGLLDFYAKVGDLMSAKQVFAEIPERDVVSNNAMISALTLETIEARMLASSADRPQKSLNITKDEKFFSSRSEIIIEKNPSLESYHGGASVAVPFMWESQPGTPKFKFRETTLPPLTPPPSYYSNTTRKPAKKHSNKKLLHNIFPKLTLRKTHLPQSPASTSSRSSSRSVPSSPITPSSYQKWMGESSPRYSFDSRVDAEYRQEYGSPVSTLCFGAARRTNHRSGGCYSSMIKLLFGNSS